MDNQQEVSLVIETQVMDSDKQASVTAADTVPPTVTVFFPNGGEVLPVAGDNFLAKL